MGSRPLSWELGPPRRSLGWALLESRPPRMRRVESSTFYFHIRMQRIRPLGGLGSVVQRLPRLSRFQREKAAARLPRRTPSPCLSLRVRHVTFHCRRYETGCRSCQAILPVQRARERNSLSLSLSLSPYATKSGNNPFPPTGQPSRETGPDEC